MDDWELFQERIWLQVDRLKKCSTSIFRLITTNKLFNGFGTNHTTEALHCAGIHPMLSSAEVFSSPANIERLLKGLYEASRLPTHWGNYINKHFDQMDPFRFNSRGWIFYESSVNKVFKKESVSVSKAWCEEVNNPELIKVKGLNGGSEF
jgi:hypothetical protein